MCETDLQLLARYVRDHAENAFAEIVRRHIDLVFSTALRQVRSAELAEEVAQSAFQDLARQAHRLRPNTILSAWLYQVTRRSAVDVVRRESRRQLREQAACELNTMNSESSDWTHIEPLLEQAMDALNDSDRSAILLRYFENKSLREVGQNFGTNEEAARKRINRAVQRLRAFFVERGITVGASGMVTVISTHAVQAAPAGLATTISTAASALAGTAIISGTATSIASSTTIQAIAMTTLQKTLLIATSVLAIGTPLLVHYQSTKALRERDARLQIEAAAQIKLQAENERLSNLVAESARDSLSAEQQRELLRLRAAASQARADRTEADRLRSENIRLRTAQAQHPAASVDPAGPSDEFPRDAWSFAGYANPEATLVSTAWAGFNSNLQVFVNSMSPSEQQRFRNGQQQRSDAEMAAEVAQEFGRTKSVRILKKESLSETELLATLLVEHENGESDTPVFKMQRIGNEWKMDGLYKRGSPGGIHAGP